MIEYAPFSRKYVWLAGFLVVCAAPPSRADSVDDILSKLEARRDKVRTLHHVGRTKAREGDVVRETTTQVWEKRSEKALKIRRSSEVRTRKKDGKPVGDMMKMLAVVDGKHEWREMPVGGKTIVFKARASREKSLEEVRQVLRLGRARVKGNETVHRQPCVVLHAVGGDRGDRFQATFWISETHGVVLKSVISRADRTRSEFETVELEVNAPIEDARFVYTPPEGATVMDTEALGGKPGDGKKP